MSKFVCAIVSCAVLALTLGIFAEGARGATITFDDLPGGGALYTGSTEGDFTVTASDNWRQTTLTGNPAPSIFVLQPGGDIEVVENTTGFFTFSSVDLNSLTNPTATVEIEGFLDGSSVLAVSSGFSAADVFETISSPDASQVLDRLVIRVTNDTASTVSLDNIVVETADEPGEPGEPPVIPEPTSLALWFVLGPVVTTLGRRRS